MDAIKLCRTCGLTLPGTEFHKRKDTASGLSPKCKKCNKAKTYLWREKNRSKWNAYSKAKASTEHYKKVRKARLLTERGKMIARSYHNPEVKRAWRVDNRDKS